MILRYISHFISHFISRSCARASAECFVDTHSVIAEQHIVHRALTFRDESECIEKHCHHGLTGLDISSNHRGAAKRIAFEWRVQNPFGYDKIDRTKKPFVHRNRFVDQESQRVERGGLGHSAWRIEIRLVHGARA